MNKTIYRTMTKDRKNHVILSHDTEKDVYYVSYKFNDSRNRWEYSHYNYACYKFELIHKGFLEIFSDSLLTNLK